MNPIQNPYPQGSSEYNHFEVVLRRLLQIVAAHQGSLQPAPLIVSEMIATIVSETSIAFSLEIKELHKRQEEMQNALLNALRELNRFLDRVN